MKDKKITVKSSSCYFFAAVCFLLSGFLMGGTSALAMASPAGIFLILGINARKKEKSRDGDSEDTKMSPES